MMVTSTLSHVLHLRYEGTEEGFPVSVKEMGLFPTRRLVSEVSGPERQRRSVDHTRDLTKCSGVTDRE